MSEEGLEATSSVEASPDNLSRYKYVIEEASDDVAYRNEQMERAESLDLMFKGKEALPAPLLDDINDEDFFMKGRYKQDGEQVKNLMRRYIGW